MLPIRLSKAEGALFIPAAVRSVCCSAGCYGCVGVTGYCCGLTCLRCRLRLFGPRDDLGLLQVHLRGSPTGERGRGLTEDPSSLHLPTT